MVGYSRSNGGSWSEGRSSLLLGTLMCLLALGQVLADSTTRLLTFNGFFTIYGVSDSSSSVSGSIDTYYVKVLQSELNKVLNFVPWQIIVTEYINLRDHENDDYVSGELHFRVEAYLSPVDNVDQYFSEVVDTLNYILVDDLLSGISIEALRRAHIPAGSLSISDAISVTSGHTSKPTTRPVVAPEKLHLLMLGDWGKGGANGDITASSTSSMSRNALATIDTSRNLAGGKSGGTDYTYQASVARSMMKYVRYLNLRAVIALGDNFYSSGVSSVTDSLWSTMWKNVYLTDSSPLNVPWYAVLGNHDYGSISNAEAQINRYKTVDDDNWIMPSHNYTEVFDIVGGGSLQIIFIDTTTLAPSVNKCCNEKGGVSVARQTVLINNQLAYIEARLQEAALNPPTWLLVAGHYPVFSAGEHGDTGELKQYLLPLLETYNVDAYFCGHDHISEHIEKEGVQYYVAGAGALTDKLGSKASDGNLVWAGAGYSAFAAVAATQETLTVNFVNIYGESVYTHTLNSRAAPASNMAQEELSTSAWLLGTLGMTNSSQAVVKLSGIGILCILVSVGVIMALDAHFVARMKSSEAYKNEGSVVASEDISSMDDTIRSSVEDPVDPEVGVDLGGDEDMGAGSGIDSRERNRGYLASTMFGENAYRPIKGPVVVVDPIFAFGSCCKEESIQDVEESISDISEPSQLIDISPQ